MADRVAIEKIYIRFEDVDTQTPEMDTDYFEVEENIGQAAFHGEGQVFLHITVSERTWCLTKDEARTLHNWIGKSLGRV